MRNILDLTYVLDLMEREIRAEGSQEAFAKRVGVTTGYLSHIRVGRRNPGTPLLKALGLRAVTMYEAAPRRAKP